MVAEKTAVSLEVYDPAGAMQTTQLFAPRLPDINGKTICELSNYLWQSERTFPAIREHLQKRFPDLKIVPFTELPSAMGVDANVLAKVLKEKKCDGVIVGNAA